jgi:hypothetical protein
MAQHGVHHLIVRIGQGYETQTTGPLPPLTIVHDPVVDYRVTPGFTGTPLGRCALRAALGVRARAVKGNYMYFEIRNQDATDPLAGAPDTLDRAAAEEALARRDEEARDCARGHPEHAKPGETIRMAVEFRGVDGRVARVDPFYVETGTPYRECFEAAYGKAVVPKFRKLSDKVVHALSP